MSNYLSEDGTFINSLIGDGTVFKGELKLNGLLRIDGDFSGTVETEGKVLVGKNGRADAMVKAGTVVIGGVLKGNIVASEKVVILSTGMLIGNITAPRMLVEDGVLMHGSFTIIPEEPVAVEAVVDTAVEQERPVETPPKRRSFLFSGGRKDKVVEAESEPEQEMETASTWTE